MHIDIYYIGLMTDTKERNELIYKFRLEGKTLQAIGTMFSITRERVRQIVARQKVISLSTESPTQGIDRSLAGEYTR